MLTLLPLVSLVSFPQKPTAPPKPKPAPSQKPVTPTAHAAHDKQRITFYLGSTDKLLRQVVIENVLWGQQGSISILTFNPPSGPFMGLAAPAGRYRLKKFPCCPPAGRGLGGKMGGMVIIEVTSTVYPDKHVLCLRAQDNRFLLAIIWRINKR